MSRELQGRIFEIGNPWNLLKSVKSSKFSPSVFEIWFFQLFRGFSPSISWRRAKQRYSLIFCVLFLTLSYLWARTYLSLHGDALSNARADENSYCSISSVLSALYRSFVLCFSLNFNLHPVMFEFLETESLFYSIILKRLSVLCRRGNVSICMLLLWTEWEMFSCTKKMYSCVVYVVECTGCSLQNGDLQTHLPPPCEGLAFTWFSGFF